MSMITGIAEIVLWTRDKHKAVAFYKDLLGLEVISSPELHNVFLKAGEGAAGIPQMIVIVPMPPEIASQPPVTSSITWPSSCRPAASTTRTRPCVTPATNPAAAPIPCSPAAPSTLTTPTVTRSS